MKRENLIELFRISIKVILMSFILTSCIAVKKHWEIAQSEDNIEAYNYFLHQHPKSDFSGEAKTRMNYLIAEKDWKEVKFHNTITVYENFLDKYPDSEFSDTARYRLEYLYAFRDWEQAKNLNTIAVYEKFLKIHPQSEFTHNARANLEKLYIKRSWEKTKTKDTIIAYEEFLKQYPQSEFSAEAQKRLTKLQKDLAIWEQIKQSGSISSFKRFIVNNPQNYYINEANALIADYQSDMKGRNIVDALKNGKIEVEVSGNGIESVNMKIRSLVNHEIKIIAPVGTYFVCRGSAQNMVSRKEQVIYLTNMNWQSYEIDAACANRSKDIPYSDESFNVRESPYQEDLKKLMPILQKSNISFSVEQAAIWIVTDNADYDDLGTLVSRSMFQIYGGTRLILEYETAKAMKICDEAGIDISRKAIWRDRGEIIKGLTDKNLKDWLIEKSEGH